MARKLKPKFNKYFAGFALVLTLAGVFLFFPVRQASAAGCDLSQGQGQFRYEKNQLYFDEQFTVYTKVEVPNQIDACKNLTSVFRFFVRSSNTGTYFPGIGSTGFFAFAQKDYEGKWNDKNATFNFDGFHGGFTTRLVDLFKREDVTKLKDFLKTNPSVDLEFLVQAFRGDREGLLEMQKVNITLTDRAAGAADHPASDQGIPKDLNSQGITAGEVFTPSQLIVSFGSSGNTHLKTEYRILPSEDTHLAFHMDWAGKEHPTPGQSEIKIDANYQSYTYEGMYAGLNFKGVTPNCLGSFDRRCQDGAFLPYGTGKDSLPYDGNVDLMWEKIKDNYDKDKNNSAPSGQPVFSKDFILFPIARMNLSASSKLFGSGSTDLALTPQPITNFTVKVYADEASRAKSFADEGKSYTPGQQEAGGDQNAVTSSNDSGGCQSGTVACFIKDVIQTIISIFQELIYWLFSIFVAPLLQAVLSVRSYTDTFVAVIYPGWQIVRNLANIFFIVALLIIALATIFRVESYQYKHLLVNLIVGAILVNFSLVIAQGVLGIADTVQNQFLPNNQLVINRLAASLMTQNLIFTKPDSNPSAYADIVYSLFTLSLSIGALLVFIAIVGFLVVRMVALWILLMLSPVPWAARVLPGTHHFEKEWWDKFVKYAFFTPVMAFFLNLTAVIADKQHDILKTITGGNFKSSDNPSITNFVFQVSSNVLLIAFLIAGIKVAEKFGIAGGQFAAGIVDKGIKAPFKLSAGAAGFGAKAAGRWAKKQYDKKTLDLARGGWLSRQAFKVTHPVAFVKAVREESKKERELYKTGVESGATEVARKQYGWRRKTESPMYLFDEHKGKELYEEEEGEWSDNEQQVIGIGNRLAREAKGGDLRAQIKLKHWFKEAFRHRNLNEAMEGENGIAAKYLGGKLNYNTNNIRYFFQQLTKEGYIDENFAAEFQKKLSKDGYETGDFNGVELVHSDPETGHPNMIEMEPVNDANGNFTGDAMPVGWEHYKTERERLINQADKDGRAEAAAQGITDEDQIAVIIEKKLTKSEKLLSDTKSSKYDHEYANSMHAERSRRYMKINMSKKNGQAQVSMFHDSIVNVGVVDGKVRLSDGGTEVLGHMDANKLYAMGRDNMPAKTRDKFMLYIKEVMKDPATGVAKIEDQLSEIIKAKYREKGEKLDPAKLSKEVDEQANLWLAAGYSILSSTPGATVMKTNFEDITKAAQARTVGLVPDDVKKYVKGDITLPRALTVAEMQGAADQATIDTKDRLVEEIVSYRK